jgi:hypothetical protein
VPFLARKTRGIDAALIAEPEGPAAIRSQAQPDRLFRPNLLGRCANPGCRSGWIHLFRKRSTPVFEGGWTCSPECTEARIRCALQRELDGRTPSLEVHRHRIPLGLLMLQQGWISREQLRKALDAQKSAGAGRLGDWLIRQHATDEAAVTRALGIQWSCPVLSVESGAPSSLAAVMPRLFLDAFGALPLRVAAGKLLYLGFEECPDPALAFAVERMMGLRVECGIVQSSAFRVAHAHVLNESFPPVQLGEAVSASAAAHMLSRAIERSQPVTSHLLRVHDCIWLRMFLAHDETPVPRIESVRDVVCSIEDIQVSNALKHSWLWPITQLEKAKE